MKSENLQPEEKDYLTPQEAIRYWGLCNNKFYLFLNKGRHNFVALYRKRKLIQRVEFEKFLKKHPEVKEELSSGINSKTRL